MLTLADSVVSDSSSVADGGGIFNSGTLTVLRSAISRNVTGIQQGGGVWNYQLAVATIIDSLIDENAAAGHGGGLSNYTGTMTVTNSTVKGNQASQGGGLDNAGASANGPAIAHLRSVTIADNLARWFGDPNRGHGGGVVNTEVCPRSVAPPHAVDPFPDGSIKDKGCGARKPDRTLGGDVLVDVQVRP